MASAAEDLNVGTTMSVDDVSRAKNVNLFFGTKNELTDVAKKDDASTSYIIFQNDRLHSQTERFQKKIRDLEKERDRAVEDSDRAERSRNCLRGMLHNEIEKSKILGDIVEQQNKGLLGQEMTQARLIGNTMIHAVISLSVHTIGWWTSGHEDVINRLMLSVHVGNFVTFGWLAYRSNFDRNKGNESASQTLRELRNKLADAERGTAHLHDIVDEM